ncbi:hypothetical protein SAMN06265360_101138 [Haloechinothrix alba]|uniref:Uncharacterized protein n=2 Tax=Haloechinothrix alba TaxID=664784 RepID=A0A238V0W1_9PSEU|nr:hypothetical protein SAMN06265360_101138 [Haloechinothrix alba]
MLLVSVRHCYCESAEDMESVRTAMGLLADGRQLTSVLYRRIASTYSLDSRSDTYADRLPHVDDPDWQI